MQYFVTDLRTFSLRPEKPCERFVGEEEIVFKEVSLEEILILPALLLQPVLDLQVGEPAHHEQEGGVDLSEVSVVAPGHSDHLPTKWRHFNDPVDKSDRPVSEVVDSGVDDDQDVVIVTVDLKDGVEEYKT